jgi:hypothetical protein
MAALAIGQTLSPTVCSQLVNHNEGDAMPDRFHHLILFDDINFGGPHKHIFRSIALLDDFNDRASSFAVLSGTWQLFNDSNFQKAQGSVFAPRIGGYPWVEDYDVANDTVSAVRLVADELRVVPQLILFQGAHFDGNHRHVVAGFAATGSWANAQSFVIFAGTWRFELANGQTVLLGPGTFPLANDVLSDRIRRLLPADATTVGPQIPHLMIFDDRDFKGAHRHVLEDLDTLATWKDRTSAIVIETGAWRISIQEDWTAPEGPILTRGIYPYVEDYDIENDKARSLRQESRSTLPALVSATKMNDGVNMLTAHGDNYRLGWNPHETQLTPANVRVPDFGLLWRRTDILGQDGNPSRVYGQPLYVSDVLLDNGESADLVIIATASNDVFALDANDGHTIWWRHLGAPSSALTDSEFSAPLSGDVCDNTSPLHGVNSTPVIATQLAMQLVYVCFLAKVDTGAPPGADNDWNQQYFLQALNVNNGTPLFPQPFLLAGSYHHPDGKTIRFRPYMHTQRGALTFFEVPVGQQKLGFILIPFGSRCDHFGKAYDEDWQGWIIGVRAVTAQPGKVLFFASSTNEFTKAGCGGIWGTAGVSVDDNLRMYTVAGNGKWDGLENWGDSIIKLGDDLVSVLDSYTPRNWQKLFDSDFDLGSCSAVLLPPTETFHTSPHNHRASVNIVATGAKDGFIYLAEADDLGGVGHALWRQQQFSSGSNLYTDGIGVTPAFFDGGPAGKFLYYCSASDSPLRGMVAVHFDDLEGEGMFGIRVLQFEGSRFSGAPGAPFVSSNGPNGGIVWTIDSSRQQHDDGEASILRAWDAVTGELIYSSPQTLPQKLGNGRKFAGLAVLKGKVLVPCASIACYGLRREDL